MTAASPTIAKRRRRAASRDGCKDATPAFLFGLRLWGSVCLSFYVAFALELSEPSWAATTAALVCQPVLGASLRKSMFRMVGTVVGAIAIVVLAAFFRQDRVGFLVGTCALVRGLSFRCDDIAQFRHLRRGALGLHGGDHRDRRSRTGWNHEWRRLHVRRQSRVEICIGIVCAGVVLALTDLGHSRRKLAAELRLCRLRSWMGLPISFVVARGNLDQFRALRRELLRRVIALYPMIDSAIGEASDLRYRSAVLRRAVAGLLKTISAWRKVAFEIALNGNAATPREASAFYDLLPRARLSPDATVRSGSRWSCATRAARRRGTLPASTRRRRLQRLFADNAAAASSGMARALNGLTGVVDPREGRRVRGIARLHVADWLPPFSTPARSS